MGSTAASSRAPSPGELSGEPFTHRGQRRLRNFLLDRHFQLKYSGYLVGIALFLSLSLGLILWQTSQQLMAQSRSSVALGEQVVERGRNLLAESEKVNAVVRMSMVEAYADDPALLEVFQGDSAKRDGLLAQGQKQLEDNSQALKSQSQMMERQYVAFGLVIVSVLLLLVVSVGLAGVVVTHKVAGPVFKMKRLLIELGKGHFRVVARLRKGDELQAFFDTFNLAADELRRRQESEIERIDGVLGLLADVDSGDPRVVGAREQLRSLRESMQVPPATRPPPTTPPGL
jgi:methyl-accepting chemotaxis protein